MKINTKYFITAFLFLLIGIAVSRSIDKPIQPEQVTTETQTETSPEATSSPEEVASEPSPYDEDNPANAENFEALAREHYDGMNDSNHVKEVQLVYAFGKIAMKMYEARDLDQDHERVRILMGYATIRKEKIDVQIVGRK